MATDPVSLLAESVELDWWPLPKHRAQPDLQAGDAPQRRLGSGPAWRSVDSVPTPLLPAVLDRLTDAGWSLHMAQVL